MPKRGSVPSRLYDSFLDREIPGGVLKNELGSARRPRCKELNSKVHIHASDRNGSVL